jgi:hypothetical protein
MSAGILSKPGTYLVQVSISYERCDREQGQTRINVGACPTSSEGSSTQSYELQSCKDVTEPGKRKLTLHSKEGSSSSSSSKFIDWQLAAAAGSSSISTEAGAQPLSCSGSACVLFVGSGSGRVQPGRSYAIRYSTSEPAAAAAGQQGKTVGFNLGFGGFNFGVGTAAAPSSSSSSSGWKELKGPVVDKCPPRVTRSAAALMGSCSSGRWLEMQAAAVDLEEGAAAAGGLKYYW